MIEWAPIWLTLKLAGLTSLILLGIGIPLGYGLAHTRWRIRPVLESLIAMPLVLPPTVLGFYLLMVFRPNGIIGSKLQEWLGLELVFSFEGLVFASVIYSLPFMVQPIQAGFAGLSPRLRETSYLLGKNRWQTLWQVLLPNIKPGLLTGLVLSFAHTLGEFGVVLMIGGNIPKETRVASIAIYDQVEALKYDEAHRYALVLCGLAFGLLWLIYGLPFGKHTGGMGPQKNFSA